MATEREIFAEDVIRHMRAVIAALEHQDSGEATYQCGELLKRAQEELAGLAPPSTHRGPPTLVLRGLLERIDDAADRSGILRLSRRVDYRRNARGELVIALIVAPHVAGLKPGEVD